MSSPNAIARDAVSVSAAGITVCGTLCGASDLVPPIATIPARRVT